jgi:hypothetical protein
MIMFFFQRKMNCLGRVPLLPCKQWPVLPRHSGPAVKKIHDPASPFRFSTDQEKSRSGRKSLFIAAITTRHQGFSCAGESLYGFTRWLSAAIKN